MISAPKPRLAARIAHIEPFHVMALLGRARRLEAQGRCIIHMEIGEPDFPTAAPIVDAGISSLIEGRTHYTPARGLAELRSAISGYYRDHHDVAVDPERIIVTPGSSGALQLLMSVLVDPADQVLMADPGYPCNRHFVRMVEGEPVSIPVEVDTGYQLTVEHLQAYWSERSRAVMIASPANPTGTVVEPDQLKAMAEFVQQRGGHMLVDEIYHGLVYEGGVKTALALNDQVFVINSFSKYFGMTGWRLGWLVAPPAYVPALEKVAQNIFLAAPTPSQHAAIAAFLPETLAILEERRLAFKARCDYLLPALRELGFDIPITPQGAFYLYADASHHTDDSYGFALDLLEQAGAAITPGIDFGFNAPQRHVRFAYTTSLERLKEGVARLATFL